MRFPGGRASTSIPELRNFGMIHPNSGAFEITIPAFADAIGMESARTLTRRANEFKSMIYVSGIKFQLQIDNFTALPK